MTEPGSANDPVRSFFGGLLLLVGGLMTALCGLCTATFFVAGLMPHGDASFTVLSLFIGSVPTGIGVLLFMGGRGLLRQRSSHPAEVTPGPDAP